MKRLICTLPMLAAMVSCSQPFPMRITGTIDSEDLDRAMAALREAPEPRWLGGARPGGAYVLEYNAPMKRLREFGDSAVPTLIANLDDEKVRYQCVQILGDLRAPRAVPKLLSMLKQEDNRHDGLIIGALGRITEHPSAYLFHRGYFDEGVRQTTYRAYFRWWEEHRSAATR